MCLNIIEILLYFLIFHKVPEEFEILIEEPFKFLENII